MAFASSPPEPLTSVSVDHSVGAWNGVLIAYFPDRVTVAALAAVHDANLALRASYPAGTTTLSILRAGMPMPRPDARAFAAKIGREATTHLRGECIVISGHPLWARTARAVLYSIELVVTPLHPRGVFESAEQAYPWALSKSGHPLSELPALHEATSAIIAANHRFR
jgi:hypothetical protein